MKNHLASLQSTLNYWLSAIQSPSFKKLPAQHLCLSKLVAAHTEALKRSLHRTVQALFREDILNINHLQLNQQKHFYLPLNDDDYLVFEQLEKLPMKASFIQGDIVLIQANKPKAIDSPEQLLNIIQQYQLSQVNAEQLQSLIKEIDNSFQNDTLCVFYHQIWSEELKAKHGSSWLKALIHNKQEKNQSLYLEQWGTLGHPWHPNYKTKLGLSAQEVVDFSPEFSAQINIIWGALHINNIKQESLSRDDHYVSWFKEEFSDIAHAWHEALLKKNLNPKDYLPIPMHPWHEQNFLHKEYAAEIAKQQLIIDAMPTQSATPSMSFRTVVPNEHAQQSSMIKLPVSLRLTSVERTVSPKSATMGPRVSALLKQILALEPTIAKYLSIVPERHGIYFSGDRQDDERSRHLSAIIRDNPCRCISANEFAIPVGSLFADDSDNRPLLEQLILLCSQQESINQQDILAFHTRYMYVTLLPLLGLYLKYGIAFEAHQQNSFIVINDEHDLSRILVRDFGDIRILRPQLESQHFTLETYEEGKTLFNVDQENFVREKFMHAILMCHIGELSLLLTKKWNIPTEQVWQNVANSIHEVFVYWQNHIEPTRWTKEYEAMTQYDWPSKAFLKMRLDNTSEDIVGTCKNPLKNYLSLN